MSLLPNFKNPKQKIPKAINSKTAHNPVTSFYGFKSKTVSDQ